METGNPAEKEFRIMIVKMIQELRKNNGQRSKNVYQRPTRTKEQTEMNNTLEATQSRITKAEKWKINDLEDRMVEITATEQTIEKRTKKIMTA